LAKANGNESKNNLMVKIINSTYQIYELYPANFWLKLIMLLVFMLEAKLVISSTIKHPTNKNSLPLALANGTINKPIPALAKTHRQAINDPAENPKKLNSCKTFYGLAAGHHQIYGRDAIRSAHKLLRYVPCHANYRHGK
jgi:hypothetical protein